MSGQLSVSYLLGGGLTGISKKNDGAEFGGVVRGGSLKLYEGLKCRQFRRKGKDDNNSLFKEESRRMGGAGSFFYLL